MSVLALVMTSCLADRLLLSPPQAGPAHNAARRMLQGPGGPIEVFVARTDPETEPAGFLLRFYGNAQLANDHVGHEAAALEGLNLEVWGVNYPGFGGSAGEPTLRGVATAARRAYAALAAHANGRPIVVWGTSIGTTAALHVAAHEKVTAVVLQNPPPLRELILKRHGWWNLWLLALPVASQVPDELDSLRNARRSTAPALFISASDDGIVPIAYQERVMKAYGGPWELALVRGAGHNDPLPEYVRNKLIATLTTWVPAR